MNILYMIINRAVTLNIMFAQISKYTWPKSKKNTKKQLINIVVLIVM